MAQELFHPFLFLYFCRNLIAIAHIEIVANEKTDQAIQLARQEEI